MPDEITIEVKGLKEIGLKFAELGNTNKKTGHVFYCRTHGHSTMAVGYPGPAYTHVDIPTNMESGASYLEVVANGIASQKYPIAIQ